MAYAKFKNETLKELANGDIEELRKESLSSSETPGEDNSLHV